MVSLGFGKFVRSDRIFALEPLVGDERGDGHRTRVWVEGVKDPIIAARTEDKILYFKADNQLKYGKIQEAVETARRAGVRVMAAITEPNKTALFSDDKKKEKK